MNPGVLELLPSRGVDQSLLLAVLVGLWLLFAFRELFGWVFIGLVVPGYLASVMVVEPAAGLAIIIEAVFTYLLARGTSDVLARTGTWSRFFGRERFFLILLLSVVVRQQCELWLFPTMGRELAGTFGLDLEFRQSFYGLGLVLVPLLANMFWKVNLTGGLVQVGVPVTLTWAVLAWVLLPLTNYDLAAMALVYEDVAISFLDGPKLQIILLVTAWLAALANHRYGWDFGGILIPALLAVAWYMPAKLATTLAEALVLYGLTRVVLVLGPLKALNLEGPRRIVLVFTLGFFLKVGIGFGIGERWPGLQVTDLFGFGYLMPSLVAAKMLGKRAVGRVLLPAVAVSMVGFVAGNLTALALELAAPSTAVAERGRLGDLGQVPPLAMSPVGLSTLAEVRAAGLERQTPVREQVLIDQRLGSAWRGLGAWLAEGGPLPVAVAERLPALGLQLRAFAAPDDGFALWERRVEGRGLARLPLAWVRPGQPGPVIWVARPASAAPLGRWAVDRCRRAECRALVWATREPAVAGPPAPPRFLGALADVGVVVLYASADAPRSAPALHLRGSAPAAIDPGRLGATPTFSRLAGAAPGGLPRWSPVLHVHPEALWQALAPGRPARPPEPLEAWLAERLEPELRSDPARDRLDRAQRRFLAAHVLAAMHDGPPAHFSTPGAWASWLDTRAGQVGHMVQPLLLADGGVALGLAPLPDHSAEGLLAVVRPEGAPTAVEAPFPRAERGVWRFATRLWRHADARTLLIARPRSTHPAARRVPRPTSRGSVMHAAHRVVHRRLARAGNGVIAQLRGFSATRPVGAPLLVALERPALDPSQVPQSVRDLLAVQPLAAVAPIRFDDGSADLVDLVASSNAQRDHACEVDGPRFVRLWLSETARIGFRRRNARPVPTRLATEVGVTERTWSRSALLEPPLLPGPEPGASGLFDSAFDAALRFARTRNPLALTRAIELAAADPTLVVTRGFLPAEGRAYLRLVTERGVAIRRAIIFEDTDTEAIWRGGVDEVPTDFGPFRALVLGGVEPGAQR